MTEDDRRFVAERGRILARGGFTDQSEAVEIVCEEQLGIDPEDDTSAAVRTLIAAAYEEAAADARRWPLRTQWHDLDAAFSDLRARGVIALHAAGVTQSDGWSDAHEEREATKASARGACFYSMQDVEGALAGDGLYLTFGAFAPDPEAAHTASGQIGEAIRDALHGRGFTVDWDGTTDTRIRMPIVWRKRLSDAW